MFRLRNIMNIYISICFYYATIINVIGQRQSQQLLLTTSQMPDTRLEKLNIYPEWITLSGFSSGGTFAQQLQFSYSSLFSGIAVFSHSYYRCGPGDGIQANYDNVCTTLGNFPRERLWSPNLALQDIENYYRQGLIENPANLRNKRLYVFAGTMNALFTTDQSLAILNIYEPYILSNCAIRTRVKAANFTLPSNRFGGPCAADSMPTFYISNCDLPGAYEALNWLLGEAVPRLPKPNDVVSLQPLQTFDQSEFFYGSDEEYEMDTLGFIYIPTTCLTTKCLLHFYFHGCSAGREFVGENHIRNSGFLEVAELNNIIMVFPQVLSNNDQNAIGCWDTYGHTGRLYATQRGGQVTAVRNMLARILGEDQVTSSIFNPNSLGSSFTSTNSIGGTGYSGGSSSNSLTGPSGYSSISSGGGPTGTSGYSSSSLGFSSPFFQPTATTIVNSSPINGLGSGTGYSGYSTVGRINSPYSEASSYTHLRQFRGK